MQILIKKKGVNNTHGDLKLEMEGKVINQSESVKVLGVVLSQDEKYSEYLVTGEKSMLKYLNKRHITQVTLQIRRLQDSKGPSRRIKSVQDRLLHFTMGHHHQGQPGQDSESPEQGGQDCVWEKRLQSCLPL